MYPRPHVGPAATPEGSCSMLMAPCEVQEASLRQRNSLRIHTESQELQSVTCAKGGPSEAEVFGLAETHVLHHIADLEKKLGTHFSDMNQKLDLLTLQLNSGFDSLNLSLTKHVIEVSASKIPSETLSRHISTGSGNGCRPIHESPAGWCGDCRNGQASTHAGLACNAQEMCSGAHAFGDLVPTNNLLEHRFSLTSTKSLAMSDWELDFIQRRHPSKCRQSIWSFLEDPDSSNGARWFSRLWGPFIVVSSVISLMQAMRSVQSLSVIGLELACDCLFVAEALLRFCICPNSLIFFTKANNVIDVAAALPLVLRIPCLAGATGCDAEGPLEMILVCVVPVIRLLKTLRLFRQFHLFVRLMNETGEALSVLLFLLCIIVLSFSALIYMVEPRDNIESLPMAMYLIIVTISTVGYGDVTPSTTIGTIAVSVIILCSVLYMALPIGILGNAFTKIWSDRDRIMLTMRTRDRLTQWGYTAADMKMLFRHFDSNKNGELNLQEFREMIAEMHIGIKDDRVVQLFDSFDKDGSGGIDPKEFTRTLFPGTYHELFGDADADADADAEPRLKFPALPRFPSKEKAPVTGQMSDKLTAASELENSARLQADAVDCKGEKWNGCAEDLGASMMDAGSTSGMSKWRLTATPYGNFSNPPPTSEFRL